MIQGAGAMDCAIGRTVLKVKGRAPTWNRTPAPAQALRAERPGIPESNRAYLEDKVGSAYGGQGVTPGVTALVGPCLRGSSSTVSREWILLINVCIGIGRNREQMESSHEGRPQTT